MRIFQVPIKSDNLFIVIGLITVLIITISVLSISTVPPLWWDEGWNLALARNWVVSDHYGQLLAGAPRSAGLSGSFPIITPLALSFNILGVGIWQARIVGVLFMVGAYLWMASLAGRLYTPRVGLVTMLVLTLAPIADELQPLLIGRQVLGEMPMMFFLLTGYGFLYMALERRPAYILAAALSWGIAFRTKAQVPPFLLVSILIPLGISLLKRSWRIAGLLIISLFGLWITQIGVGWAKGFILGDLLIPEEAVLGLYQVTALVFDLEVRRTALQHVLSFGLPTLLGLGFAGWEVLPVLQRDQSLAPEKVVKTALLSLVGSWIGWYLLLGMMWIRYLFPSVFIGSLFAAAVLGSWTDNFDFRATFQNLKTGFWRDENRTKSQYSWIRPLAGLLLTVWLGVAFLSTIVILVLSFMTAGAERPDLAAEYLNNNIPTTALIETYDSELLFLGTGLFHYPPDEIHVQLIRREFIDAGTILDYDPLAADPDFLVVGPFSRRYRLYDPVLKTGQFELVAEVPGYEIYQRVVQR